MDQTMGAGVPVQVQNSVPRLEFLFRREVPFGMALLRIALPWTLLINIFQRWTYVRELYTQDGAPGPLADNFGIPGFLPELPASLGIALFAAMTWLLISGSIGWCTRFSFLVSSVLYFYFSMMDCMSTITKYTVIGNHLLLLLGVSECGAVWSVDHWLRRRRAAASLSAGRNLLLPRTPLWPSRLVQILVGVVYFGAAVTKMHTPAFFSGDQLMYWMMTYINNQHPLGDRLAQYPVLLSAFGYIAIIWEMVFLFLAFHRIGKWYVLALGVVFHVMTAFTLGLYIFPLVMISSYLAFFSERDVRAILNWPGMRHLTALMNLLGETASGKAPTTPVAVRPAWANAVVFGLAMTFVSVAAIEADYWIDPYQMRGAEGPLPLREMADEEIDRIFNTDVPMRQVDKLLAFDLGTATVGEHLINRRREFRLGEQVIAQMTLNPPHEDMWVDCILTDAVTEDFGEGPQIVPGKQLQKFGNIVLRESFRTNFYFRMEETMTPGDYFLKLRSGGEEIAQKRFTLLPKVNSPVAN